MPSSPPQEPFDAAKVRAELAKQRASAHKRPTIKVPMLSDKNIEDTPQEDITPITKGIRRKHFLQKLPETVIKKVAQKMPLGEDSTGFGASADETGAPLQKQAPGEEEEGRGGEVQPSGTFEDTSPPSQGKKQTSSNTGNAPGETEGKEKSTGTDGQKTQKPTEDEIHEAHKRAEKEREFREKLRKARQKAEDAKGGLQKAKAQYGLAKTVLSAGELGQKITAKLLQSSWRALIMSFGATYIYIFIHFLAYYLSPFKKAFIRPGMEWLPEQMRKTSAGKSAGIGLMYAEIIVFLCLTAIVGIITFIAILLIYSFIVLVIWAQDCATWKIWKIWENRSFCTDVLKKIYNVAKDTIS